MTSFAGNARIKTALMFAASFLALACLIMLASEFVGIVGAIFSEAMIVGSPFCWWNDPVRYLLGLSQALLYPLVLAPYALLGGLIGYCWPLRNAGVGRLVRSVFLRFAMVWVPIVAIGVRRVFTQ